MRNDTAPLRVLVFGAGVLGSLYAARLADAGHEVSLVARGRRYRDLREHGIVLEYFDTGERTTTQVRTLDAMPTDEHHDLCLVAVQKTQLEAALPVLATNTVIPTFLFMVNTAEGPQAMIDALGRERVMLSFANAGGERDGHLVRLMVAKRKAVTMGELDGSRSERLLRVKAAFESAGFPVQPPALRFMLLLPNFVLVPLMQRLIASPIMDIGGKRHALAAREEMTALNEELLAMAEAVGMDTPMMRKLHRYSDPAVPPAFAA